MDEVDGVNLSGWDVVELMWPLNDMFRARLMEIGPLRYDAAFEAEADEAIKAMADDPVAPWAGLSPGAWRVLLERHQQLLTVAAANEAAGNPMIKLPAGLEEGDRRIALMLIFLLRMKLPSPPADRSRLQLPSKPPPRPN